MTNNIRSKADTHLHTTYSDGVATPTEMVDYVASQTDLRVIAITDHDTTDGAFVAQAHARRQGLDLDVIVGQEVTTDEGDIIGLFLNASLPQYATALEAVHAIHAQGGLAIAAHPFSYWATATLMCGVGSQIATLPLDGVEVRNGFPTNVLSNPLTTWWNRHQSKHSELGGSDSHVPYTAGQAFTWFPGSSAEDLRTAIELACTRAGGTLWTPTSIARTVPTLLRHGMPSRPSEPIRGEQALLAQPAIAEPRR
jgi:predicted metal-dependent phosphoesterase TrpH